MKKIIVITAISAVLLCGCTAGKPAPTAAAEAETAPERTAAQSAESTVQSTLESANTPETEAPAAPVTADDFVSVEITDTGFGEISCPVFNAEKLDADDAKAANALFEYIKNDILNEAEELKELSAVLSPEEYAEIQVPASETYISLYNGILSVLVSREHTFGYLGTYYKSVNFDISTGKAVGSDELIKAAALTDNDVKQSILWYTKTYTLNMRDERYISGCLYTGALPEFYSHDGLSNDEKVLCEIALNNYDNGNEYSDIETEGMPWEKLPLTHTAFISESGQLYVFGTIAPGGQIPGKMVAVAKNDGETAIANLSNEFGAMRRKPYIMPEDVPNVLADIVGDIEPTYDIEGVISVFGDEEQRPAYSVNVFSNTGYAPALVAKYAVSLFDGLVWEMVDYGEWVMVS